MSISSSIRKDANGNLTWGRYRLRMLSATELGTGDRGGFVTDDVSDNQKLSYHTLLGPWAFLQPVNHLLSSRPSPRFDRNMSISAYSETILRERESTM